MRAVSQAVSTMLMLIGLYLVLRHGANASRIIGSLATGTGKVFKTLQGR